MELQMTPKQKEMLGYIKRKETELLHRGVTGHDLSDRFGSRWHVILGNLYNKGLVIRKDYDWGSEFHVNRIYA
jgi:hypothetical protein